LTWRPAGGNGGVLVLVLLLSITGVVFGSIADDVWLMIGAAVVGAVGLFLYVVNNRRPAWELRAQELANMVTSPGPLASEAVAD